MNTHTLLNALVAHSPADPEEEKHRGKLMQFVSSHTGNWWRRENDQGHVTGSAWVVNQAHTHALLLHHVKLNLWVQPGGHLDDTDLSPAAGALREALEETGIPNLTLASETVFDVDIHSIPARSARPGKMQSEPAHLHYDVRYLIIAEGNRVAISEESLDAKWILLENLAQPAYERSIARMAEKSLRMRS